jgi:hypothetical protein
MAVLRSVLIATSVAAAMMFPADVRADDDVRADVARVEVTHDSDVGDSLSLLALAVLVGGVTMVGVSNLRRPDPTGG